MFDKDGTLLDFAATWYPAIGAAIEAAAPGDEAKRRAIGDALGYDIASGACAPGAPVVHVANAKLAKLLDPVVGDGRAFMGDLASRVVDTVTPVPAAASVLEALHRAGIPCAVATNDDEAAAKAQLARLGWDKFSCVLACDSGFGSKPAPGMLLEAARRLGLEPSDCCMVGDAKSDLEAARAAGFGAAILVGADRPPDVRELADVELEDLGGLLRPRGGRRSGGRPSIFN